MQGSGAGVDGDRIVSAMAFGEGAARTSRTRDPIVIQPLLEDVGSGRAFLGPEHRLRDEQHGEILSVEPDVQVCPCGQATN